MVQPTGTGKWCWDYSGKDCQITHYIAPCEGGSDYGYNYGGEC